MKKPSTAGEGDKFGVLALGVGVAFFFGLVFLGAAVELSLIKFGTSEPRKRRKSLRDNLAIINSVIQSD